MVRGARGYPPMITVGAPGPTMLPVPGGTLLAQGMTMSPTLAAGCPPISTVALPILTLPSLVGEAPGAGAVPGGVGKCGGTFCNPLPVTAAGLPPIKTVFTQPVRILPVYGCGKGVGTGGPGGAGTITICVQIPGALSPSTAAGPVGISPATVPGASFNTVTPPHITHRPHVTVQKPPIATFKAELTEAPMPSKASQSRLADSRDITSKITSRK